MENIKNYLSWSKHKGKNLHYYIYIYVYVYGTEIA